MKHFFLSLLLLTGFGIHGFSQIISASKLSEVTVYLEGAQIKRTATVSLPKGNSTIVFNDLSSLIVDNSVRVKSIGDVKIQSVSLKKKLINNGIRPESTSELEKAIGSTQKKLDDKTGEYNAVKSQQNLYSSSYSIKGEQTGISAQNFKEMVTLFGADLAQINKREAVLRNEINELRETVTALQQELDIMKTIPKKIKKEIEVQVSSNAAGNFKFEIEYITDAAKWMPEYDIRANSIDEPLELTLKANISQYTGEDWKNVTVNISNGNSNLTIIKPELNPLFIDLNSTYRKTTRTSTSGSNRSAPMLCKGVINDTYGAPIPFVSVIAGNTTIGTVTDIDGNFSLTIPQNASFIKIKAIGYEELNLRPQEQMQIVLKENDVALQEVEIVSTSRYKESNDVQYSYSAASIQMAPDVLNSVEKTALLQGIRRKKSKVSNETRSNITPPVEPPRRINIEYTLENKATIPSNNEIYTVEVVDQNMESEFKYFAIPKIDNHVYLTAFAYNWENLNILDAQANLFFEGKYVGQTALSLNEASDTLEIALGQDKSITIERTKVRDITKTQSIGSNKVENRKFDIRIKNSKPNTIELIVQDQIPVSKNVAIEITDIDISNGGKHNLETGLIQWDLKIDPNKSENLTFKYTGKYPKQYNLIID